MINKYGGTEGAKTMNKYLMYLFVHKYITMLVGRKVGDLEQGIKKMRESMGKWREKIEA